MKTKWILLMVFASLVSCSNAQEKNNNNNNKQKLKNEPKENIKVNKEYDKNGNLIKFDSTYTYYYSNIKGDTAAEDSIFNQFRKEFYNNYPLATDSIFNQLFFQDSLMQYDFYKNDFFTKRYQQNEKEMEKVFGEMDSLKNKFFENQFSDKK